jgi:hypothetical protein
VTLDRQSPHCHKGPRYRAEAEDEAGPEHACRVGSISHAQAINVPGVFAALGTNACHRQRNMAHYAYLSW